MMTLSSGSVTLTKQEYTRVKWYFEDLQYNMENYPGLVTSVQNLCSNFSSGIFREYMYISRIETRKQLQRMDGDGSHSLCHFNMTEQWTVHIWSTYVLYMFRSWIRLLMTLVTFISLMTYYFAASAPVIKSSFTISPTQRYIQFFTLKITLQLTFMNCHNLFSSLKSLNNLFDCSSNSCTPALPCLTKEGRLLPIQRPVSLCWM